MEFDSMDFEQLLAEQKSKLVRALTSRGLALTPDKMDLVKTIFENTARSVWTEMRISPPKRSTSLNTIKVREDDKVIGWHPVDGQWRQIVQIPMPDGTIAYYTDSKREEPVVERPNIVRK